MIEPMKYKTYDLRDFRSLPQVERYLSERQRRDIEIVANVFPFKANNYVVEKLIDWRRVPDDPMFVLTFPQKGMLLPEHYDEMRWVLESGAEKEEVRRVAHRIRLQLNPHPDGQMEHNVPSLDGQALKGIQHKYAETVLFFPSQGQTCHAYCTFCFRWPQFVGIADWKFAMREVEPLIEYLRENPEVTDVLVTGGDPMVMKPRVLRGYLEPLLDAGLPNLRTIRIGTKALSYWPYKFVTDAEAPEILDLFRDVAARGVHLAFMAHVNHPVELSTDVAREATRNILSTGAVIRSQTPLLRNINAESSVWRAKWQAEVELGIVPYYMFVVRDTGAQHFFSVPLVEAWRIYRDAYRRVSGLARTARGPSMSADPGKVEVLGPGQVNGERVLTLRFLQGRDPDWVDRPFFAEYDEDAIWLDDLRPAFGDRFFFEEEISGYTPRPREGQAPRWIM